ncbi:hypothetical protein SpCBS45565_g06359 [Spizellomyces sp. 'palustris']|nr:hypothetical protein SpCBS45565_g06359 [Spizellomyces sp. 'palustris']
MSETIQNLASYDPFADTGEESDLKILWMMETFGPTTEETVQTFGFIFGARGEKLPKGRTIATVGDEDQVEWDFNRDGLRIGSVLLKVFGFGRHIRVQQRNGRKTLTTVQGLPADLDQKRILKAFKKEFACNGTVVQDEDLGEVIQLQGDHRLKIQQFLASEGLASKDKIKIHGF